MPLQKQISVSLYIARIHKRREKSYLPIDAINGSIDLLALLHKELKSRHNQFVPLSGGTRRLQVTKDLKFKDRVVDGTLEVGEAGHTSILKDVRSGAETYRRQTTDAEMVPLYFRAWAPKDAHFAAFAFQHFADYGCKTPVYDILQAALKAAAPEYVLIMREAVPGEIIDAFVTQGLVKQLRFTRLGVPRDRADAFDRVVSNPDDANIELNIIAKRGRGLTLAEIARNIFSGQQFDPKNFLEFDGIEFNRFKMRISLEGKDRWLTFGQFVNMHSRMDVSENIVFGPGGHPTRASISAVCEALLDRIAEQAWV